MTSGKTKTDEGEAAAGAVVEAGGVRGGRAGAVTLACSKDTLEQRIFCLGVNLAQQWVGRVIP